MSKFKLADFMGLRGLPLLIATVLLGSCTSGPGNTTNTPSSAAGAQATETASPADPNSLEAMRAEQDARERLPGKAHYASFCAHCHEGTLARAPHREMLTLMTPETILQSMSGGLMSAQASALTTSQKREIAEYLGGRTLDSGNDGVVACNSNVIANPGNTHTRNWGFGYDNKRHVTEPLTQLTAENAGQLRPRWAFAFPGANRVRSQPLFIDNSLVVGSHSGAVWALELERGCVIWRFQAAAEVRTGIVSDKQEEPTDTVRLYFGDVLGNAYAIDARTGKELWRTKVDAHPNATITGTPSLLDDTLYVPVSALEVSSALNPDYECCTFRGSVVALDTATGVPRWQTYTIAEPSSPRSRNASGTQMFGPSGAVIWNSPSIDIKRQRLYVGTGENASSPATRTSDAIIAINLADGSIAWSYQATQRDAWNTACGSSTPDNCPEEDGPDYDFGAATLLVQTSSGRELVVGGQKSGEVHALDADDGRLVWKQRVGRGGIQGGVHFGIAADNQHVYVPVTDMADGRTYPHPAAPGIHALAIDDGSARWYAASSDICDGRRFCHPGISQSITVANNLVLAGGMDGMLRGHDSQTGEISYELNTLGTFDTATGQTTTGGSFGGAAGPVAQGNLLAISSGYGLYNHMPGNLLLLLELPD